MYVNVYIYIYIYTYTYIYIYICACVYGGSRKVGMCPQKQIDPKPQVPTLILEAKLEHGQKLAKGKVGTCIAARKELQLLGSLQYCRKSFATAATAPVLQKERNCNYYNCSSIAEKETSFLAKVLSLSFLSLSFTLFSLLLFLL